MSSLKENIDRDPELVYEDGVLYHRRARQTEEPPKILYTQTLQEVAHVASEFLELGYRVRDIETPALSRIVGKHIFEGSMNKMKARDIGVLLYLLAQWREIF